MSGVGSSTICGAPSRFFSLPSATTTGRKSATAAAITTTSWSRAARSIASCISAAVSTRITVAPCGRREADGGHERDGGTPLCGLRGDGIALLAGTAVGDDAHGVDRFAGAARRHDDANPVEVLRAEHALRTAAMIVSRSARRPAPVSPPARRPDRRLHDVHATLAEHGDVVDHARVFPHLGVHRRAHHDGRARGDQRVGQQVGRQPHAIGGDDPRGGRRDEDQVGTLADLGVRDRRGRVVPQFGLHRFGCQRAERRAADEVFGALRS